jgi:hypothetical protein
MDLKLPQPVAAYFIADRIDAEAVARCFTSEPFAAEEKGGKTIVTGRVTGTFPGSPVDLRYSFGLEGDSIASLEISP